LKDRYEAHALALRSGLSNQDERRALEDLAPLPNGEGQKFNWPPFATKGPDDADGSSQPA
jgi:hypothetical protein